MQVGWVKYNAFFSLLSEFLFYLSLRFTYVVVWVHNIVVGTFVEIGFWGVDKIIEIEGHMAEFTAESL